MAGKDILVKKYVVRLSAEEREHLQTLIDVVARIGCGCRQGSIGAG
jgi:hypothetical protein